MNIFFKEYPRVLLEIPRATPKYSLIKIGTPSIFIDPVQMMRDMVLITIGGVAVDG